MRREDLKPELVRRAVELYLQLAYTGELPERVRDDARRLDQAQTLDELFAMCSRPPEDGQGPLQERYTLRLGNEQYPFMKFVVQEYLLQHEFFFSVDTHDDIDIGPDNPDYAGWLEVKRSNRALKDRIEAAWAAAGLPTHGDLRELAVDLARGERDEVARGRLLIADDEEDVARGLQAMLEARGYHVEVAYDGRSALERLRREPLPDLVLLDYAMPELNGAEVLDQMRADPRTRDLPVLLATASSIDLRRMGRLRGLLRKPYPREVLFALVEKILATHAGAGRPG